MNSLGLTPKLGPSESVCVSSQKEAVMYLREIAMVLAAVAQVIEVVVQTTGKK